MQSIKNAIAPRCASVRKYIAKNYFGSDTKLGFLSVHLSVNMRPHQQCGNYYNGELPQRKKAGFHATSLMD